MTLSDIIYLKFIPPDTLFILRVIFLTISLILISAIILFLKNSSWLKTRYGLDLKDFLEAKAFKDIKYEKNWNKILKRLERKSESEFKLAIIEADSLLNQILEKMGYQGDSLGERLQKLDSSTLSSLDQVWEAHKFRNNIVHDPDFRVSGEEAERHIKAYEKALQDLNVLG